MSCPVIASICSENMLLKKFKGTLRVDVAGFY
jgi:hypothetical protein